METTSPTTEGIFTVLEPGQDHIVVRVTDVQTEGTSLGRFQVARKVIDTHTTLLDEHKLENGELVLEEWSILAVSLWFHLLHGKPVNTDHIEPKVLTLDLDPRNVWFLVSFYKMYVKNQEDDSQASCLLGSWWADYYQNYVSKGKPNAMELRRLTVPAFHIGNSQIFMKLTRDWCMHHTDEMGARILDESGKGIIEIDGKMLGQLSFARGNMIGKIERDLAFDKTKDGPRCHRLFCDMKVMFSYLSALQARAGCWPVGRSLRSGKSIHAMLTRVKEKLNFVPYASRTDVPQTPTEAKLPGIQSGAQPGICSDCHGSDRYIKSRLERKVKERMTEMLKPPHRSRWIFEGLCIDCLTTTKTGSCDSDYWQHVSLEDFEYDETCSTDHGQPTWYFSFLGRKEDMDAYLRQQRKRAFPPRRERGKLGVNDG